MPWFAQDAVVSYVILTQVDHLTSSSCRAASFATPFSLNVRFNYAKNASCRGRGQRNEVFAL